MLPSVLARQVSEGAKAFLRSQFRISTPGFAGMIERFADGPASLVKGPYLSMGLPFLAGAADARRIFPGLHLPFPPYAHQETAFQRLRAPHYKSTLVATGTGSGKTECFLYPILAHCLEHAGQSGIKAILVYPMNALATDQAKRFARAISSNPTLKGKVRAGLYVGGHEADGSAVMDDEHVITIRQVLRQDPPDILMTNYKMLDYLLIRPEDAPLWAHNAPETLRYLVVDELHTFDGAQGADLACLIRRLKDRLKTPSGHLACVGTSATLGGIDESEAMCRFASTVFDAEFPSDALITEQRMDANAFLASKMVVAKPAPGVAQVFRLDPANYVGIADFVAGQAEIWLGLHTQDAINDSNFKLELSEQLKTLPAVQNLLRMAAGRLTTIDELVESSSRWLGAEPIEDSEASYRYRRLLVDSLLSLLAFARVPLLVGDREDWSEKLSRGENVPLAPMLQLRLQVWLRELRRMVASVQAEPKLVHFDDLDRRMDRGTLPVVHCRECGATGWLAARQHATDQSLRPGLRDIYTRFFSYDPLTCVFYPGSKPSIANIAAQWKICADCRRLNSFPATKCFECQSETLTAVFEPDIIRTRQTDAGQRQYASHDCPQCGSKEGLTIVGVQATSLASVATSSLFTSPFQDDKKLIAFSDSVQDAAHRAGFWSTRTWRTTFRTALMQEIVLDNATTLKDAATNYARSWRSNLGQEAFIARFLPNDMMWLNDWRALIEKGTLTPGSDLADLVERRLDWEITAEFGFNAAFGATLENVGLATAHPDPQHFDAAVLDLHQRLINEVDSLRTADAMFSGRLLAGVLRRLRQQGGILHSALSAYIANDGRTYLLGQERFMRSFSPRAPAPRFLATARGSGGNFEKPGDARSWFTRWLWRLLFEEIVLVTPDEDLVSQIYTILLAAVERHELARKGETKTKINVWGLLPDSLHVTGKVTGLECDRCGFRTTAALDEFPWVKGGPCPCPDRDGHWGKSATDDGYWHDLYAKGEPRRIFAAEHTGLLERDTRTHLEERFINGNVPWAENLLSATSTLEMGIDIGDLSSVLLASIPPEQANYAQRVGRAGRTDGNSFITAIANSRPHDRVFWAKPESMIAGPIQAPGIFLDASAILYRQFTGFSLDRWVASGIGPEAIPITLGPVLETLAIDPRPQDRFPFTWLTFIERNRSTLIDDFLLLFKADLSDDSRAQIRRFVEGGAAKGGVAWRVLDELEAEHRRRRDLDRERRQVRDRINIRKKDPQTEERDNEINELDREARLITDMIRNIRERRLLEFLSDRGLIANYAFPEEGITLKSFVWWKSAAAAEGSGDQLQSRTFEYGRPAHVALTELAPNAMFYAEGRRVKITRVDLSAGRGEDWRLCPACSHAEPITATQAHLQCPKCGDLGWPDVGSKQSLLRLTSVIAATSDRDSRIGDERDDREPLLHEKRTTIEHADDAREETYVVDDEGFAFGFEFVKRATLREINFGRHDVNEQIRVNGELVSARPFMVCVACGHVEPDTPRQPAHARSCRYHDKPADADLQSLRLYRQIDSEALKILMPSSATTDTDWFSFIAAIERGLTEYFRGDVGHLRTQLIETKEPGQVLRRRYLYLYDSVPGGTGYLKQLMQKPEQLHRLLELAKKVLDTCGCDDGCHQCVYSYRLNSRLDQVSRHVAQGLLDSILLRWDKLKASAAGLEKLDNNALFESQLETMFVEALRRQKDWDGVPLIVRREILASKKAGYFVGAGKARWYVEPQTWVGPLGEKSRADFLFVPAAGEGMRIAVFTDGFAYHRNRVSVDLLQRQAIGRCGDILVWSLTWDDVQSAINDASVPPANNPLIEQIVRQDATIQGQLAKTLKVEALLGAEKEGSFAWLMRWLNIPPAELKPAFGLWGRWGVFRMLLWGQPQPELADVWHPMAQKYLPPLIAVKAEELSRRKLLAHRRFPSAEGLPGIDVLAAVNPAELEDPSSLFLAVIFEDPPSAEGARVLHWWQAFLRLVTLAQFLPDSACIDRQGLAKGSFGNLITECDSRAAASVKGTGHANPWDAVAGDIDNDLAAALRNAGVPPPHRDDIGVDIAGVDGAVIAQAELAWPAEHVAIVILNEDAASLAAIGWRTFLVAEVIREPKLVLQALSSGGRYDEKKDSEG